MAVLNGYDTEHVAASRNGTAGRGRRHHAVVEADAWLASSNVLFIGNHGESLLGLRLGRFTTAN